MATIRDVAKLAGVSVATVSRVINKSGYVNKETEQAVQQAIKMLNYEPNRVARGLASKKTETIALIMPNISNPFFAELARAVEDVARSYGYTVLICNSDNESDKEQTYINVLKKRYVDGILFATHSLQAADISAMNDAGIPLVFLDRGPSESSCYVVRSKNYEGAKKAVAHLLDVGCKKIAHIYGPQETATGKERMLGYEDSVRHFDWFTPSLMVPGHFRINGGMEAVEQLMARHPDVDGIFCGNDLMALGALKKLQQMGMSVPDQVALCGFDGIELTVITEPELTTIAQPIYDIGALSTQLLVKKIEGEAVDNQFIYEFDAELVARGSSRKDMKTP